MQTTSPLPHRGSAVPPGTELLDLLRCYDNYGQVRTGDGRPEDELQTGEVS